MRCPRCDGQKYDKGSCGVCGNTGIWYDRWQWVAWLRWQWLVCIEYRWLALLRWWVASHRRKP